MLGYIVLNLSVYTRLPNFREGKKFGYLWVICHHFFSPGIKLNEFGLGLGLGLVITFF